MRTTCLTTVIVALCAATASAQGVAVERPQGTSQLPTVRAAVDFDEDGKTDLAVFRPDTGMWYIAYSSTNYSTFSTLQWRAPGDTPITGVFQTLNATRFRPGVFRRGLWVWPTDPGDPFEEGDRPSGSFGSLPVPGDYDGDGLTDFATYMPAPYPSPYADPGPIYARWIIDLAVDCPNEHRYCHYGIQFGGAGDIPVPADYDGDGRTDAAVYNAKTGLWRMHYYIYPVGFAGSDQRTAPAGGTPAPADYDGDGRADVAVWMDNPSVAQTWFVHLSSSDTDIEVTFGQAGDVPIAGDYDGDGRADMALFRPSTGTVYINTAANQFAPTSTYTWGMAGDVYPVSNLANNATAALRVQNDRQKQTDFDRDSFSDMVVYRPAATDWYILRSIPYASSVGAESVEGWNQSLYWSWGEPGDLPVPGDYAGSGRADPAMFNPSTGMWSVLATRFDPSDGRLPFQVGRLVTQWGLAGDIPVPGDYDGNGQMDLAVYRPANHGWYVLFLSGQEHFTFGGTSFVQWGLDGDIPVPADYNGDGKTDMALFRPVNGTWYILQSSPTNAFLPLEIQFGLAGDVPVPGDYSASGRAQVAVYRPSGGLWYTFPDRAHPTQWGLPGDIPVLGDFDKDYRQDFTVYRPTTGEWWVLKSRSRFRTFFVQQWGLLGDIPVTPWR